jgi:hypothetical protein
MSEERTVMERRSMSKKRSYWHWLGALGAVLVPAIVTAALTLPNTFTAGTVIKAADVNANFAAVVTHASGVDTSIASLQTQVATLQAAAPIAYAKITGATVAAFGGVGTTAVATTGTGFPYNITFTGTYPAAISAAKIVVQATAESAQTGVANAIVNAATTTSISVAVYVWAPPGAGATTTGALPNNPIFVTLSLGK